MTATVAAFYKFVTIGEPELLQASVASSCERFGSLGTVLIAREGLNATVSGREEAIYAFLSWLSMRTIKRLMNTNMMANSTTAIAAP